MENDLNLKILEAIQVIAKNCPNHQISYEVKHAVEKQPFKKEGIQRVYIDIQLTKLV